jgi:hypothetical protein
MKNKRLPFPHLNIRTDTEIRTCGKGTSADSFKKPHLASDNVMSDKKKRAEGLVTRVRFHVRFACNSQMRFHVRTVRDCTALRT